MSAEEVQTVRLIEQAISNIINAISINQLIGNAEFHITAHEWPGRPSGKRSSKTGYGFNIYLDYMPKGNAGKRFVLIDKDMDADQPGATIYDHVSFEEYIKVLYWIIKELHRRFDFNKINKEIAQHYQSLLKSITI